MILTVFPQSIKRKVLLCVIFPVLLTVFNMSATAFSMDVSIVGDRITLHANDAPLRSILEAVTKDNIVVRIAPDINPLITASFEKSPLHSGLKSILHSYNFALTWKITSDNTGENFALAGIQIFKMGGRAKMQYLNLGNNYVVLEKISSGEQYVKGEVLIRITGKDGLKWIEELLVGIQGRIIEEDISSGLYRIQVAEETDIYALVEQINSEIEGAAEPNFVYALSIPENRQSMPPVSAGYPDSTDDVTIANGTVAILDSGLTAGQGVEPFVVASLNPFDADAPLTDTLGHGTQMAMLATGMVTPIGGSEIGSDNSVSIIPVKIFNEQGLTTNFTLIESVKFALENNVSIISLSWGTETRSNFLEQTMQQADNAGVIVLAAAGNEPTGIPVYPAAYDTVIGVGALGVDGKPWEKSNYGDFVSIYGPGMAFFLSDSEGYGGTQQYAGTSISTAYVAGSLSTFLGDNPGASKEEIFVFLGVDANEDVP